LAAFLLPAPLGWAIGAGLGLAGLAALAVFRTREAPLPAMEELGAEGRWSLRPLREAAESFRRLARSHGDDPGIAMIAAEAAAEAELALERAAKLLALRQRLKRALKGQGESETAVGRLERQMDGAGPAERAALERALESRRSELAHFQRARAVIAEIDGKLRQAEAELSGLKARLLAGSVAAQAQGLDDTEFQDTVARLRALGRSFDEVQELVEKRA
jgi:hypothetical protein